MLLRPHVGGHYLAEKVKIQETNQASFIDARRVVLYNMNNDI